MIGLWRATLVLFLSAGPALAQTGKPDQRFSPFGYRHIEVSRSESRAMLSALGKCVVRNNSVFAAKYLLAESAAEAIKYRSRLNLPDCIKDLAQVGFGNLSFGAVIHPPYLDFAIADAMIIFWGPHQPLTGLDTLPKLSHVKFANVDLSRASRDERVDAAERIRRTSNALANVYLDAYGECVVRKDPASSLRLLATTPDSPAERAVLIATMDVFKACLAPESTLKLLPESLRGTIAYNYFRLMRARRNVAAGSGLK